MLAQKNTFTSGSHYSEVEMKESNLSIIRHFIIIHQLNSIFNEMKEMLRTIIQQWMNVEK